MIPELEAARVRQALDEFCDRIPAHVRSKVTNIYWFKGNTVTLIERRPHYTGIFLGDGATQG